MRVLIAVETCHQYRPRTRAQFETWGKDVAVDCWFFLGRGNGSNAANLPEVLLDVDDGYRGLPAKTQAICRWALNHGYDFVFKCDDDTYVQPERLLASGFESHDYIGRVRGPAGIFPAPYCSGFAYWLSAKAMKVMAEAELNGDEAEDRFVGNALYAAGIAPHPDYRYVVVESQRNARSAPEGPRQGNNFIAACEFPPAGMHRIHQEWLTKTSELKAHAISGKLSKVAVLVKTFLRDNFLFRCVRGLETRFPEVKLVIADDGYEQKSKISLYAQLRDRGHVCLWLPFDSGFGAKGNAAIPHFQDRDYVLVASDDFDFETPGLREGIEKMVQVLDCDHQVDIVGGRVNGRAYESCLRIGGNWVQEVPGHREHRVTAKGVEYQLCDLTVNFSLIRSGCFGPDRLHWDGGEVKIGGGEHGAFFLDAHRLGYGVAVIPEVTIREFPRDPAQCHPMYFQMRKRANLPGRACLKKRGIEKWGLQDGSWEEC